MLKYFPACKVHCVSAHTSLCLQLSGILSSKYFKIKVAVSFNAVNNRGLLVLLNALVKMLFLLCAHLSWEMKSSRLLSKLVSHALDSEVMWNLSTLSFLKWSRVICWKVTAHLLHFSFTILLRRFYWCQFSCYDWLQPPSTGFSWAFSARDGIGAAAAFLTALLWLWQAAENGLPWTELNLRMYERSTIGNVHGELFITIQFSKAVKYWNIKGKIWCN